jgi:hypothetical protein
MNDKELLGDHSNGLISNSVVVLIMLMSFGLAVVSIPLEYFGS